VQYKVPSTEREYGNAQLRDLTRLPEDLVAAGWLKVREDAGRKEESEEAAQRLERLRDLEADARSDGRGMWAVRGDGVIQLQNDLGASPADFVAQWKGKEIDGIIERVLSADRLLVRLVLSDTRHAQVMTLLAGVRAPATARTLTSTGQTQPAEEYGNEAKAFVEPKLHQRRIKVWVAGANPQGQLIGSIIHPAGNIAELLLREGLARCNDFHSTMLGDRMAPLRAAEHEAQARKLRLHRNHVAKAADAGSDMVVVKIIGSDTILVRAKNGSGAERRINFSSIRGPRVGEAAEAPFRDEAKEYLRKRLIGKHVHIKVDGRKPATDKIEESDVATVTEKGRNVGLQLVHDGWATVVRHRKDDTDRAPNYDELLAAQEAAREEKRGMWSGKPSKARQYVDVSDSAQKAKVHLSTLSRQRKIPAIVDFCKAGSRFTILIPREGVKLTMVLGGIRAPRAPRGGSSDGGEPFGAEALELANRRCNQRDCEVDLYDVDKVGGFIGDLYVGRESFAKVLVEEGLAAVHAYSAERAGNAADLFAAEERAKEGRKGIWHSYDPSQDAAPDADDAAADNDAAAAAADNDASADAAASSSASRKPADYRNIVITNVDANGRLKIQQIGTGTAALETLMSEFKRFHISPQAKKPLPADPKTGDLVAARFSEDGQWYRARVRSNDRAAKVADVVFIDYGNAERKPWAELRALDAQFSTAKLRPQAIDASLSLVQLPVAPEYFADARAFIAAVTDGHDLVGAWDHEDAKEGVVYMTVYAATKDGRLPGPAESINRDVIANGHGMVPRKLKAWERAPALAQSLAALREVETQAKAERRGMWEYGDITE
jgi:staphylococcal nuclease domain-containing protein 1